MSIKKLIISPFIFITTISLLGFIIGVVTVALWQENWLLQENVLDLETIHKMNHMYVDKRALFFLCLGKRLRAFFVLIIMSFTSINLFYLFLFFGIRGFAVGSILEVLLIQYGIQGGVLYFSCILPQGLFYMIGYGMVGCHSVRISSNEKKRDISRLIMAFILILIGIVTESYLK